MNRARDGAGDGIGDVIAGEMSEPRLIGRRLITDRAELAGLPPWMQTLTQAVDGRRLPGPIARLSGAAPAAARRGAVLMLFADGPAGPDLLLTQRSATMRSHAGQPAFPGGANDPGEDAVTAALRESYEETGVVPASVLPVAVLPELFLAPSSFLVSPVLAYWREPGEVRAVDPAETATVARVPVSELSDPANRGQVRLSNGWMGPAFRVADLLVWGFTAGLVDSLLELGGWSQPWDRHRLFHLPGFS